MKVLVGTVCCIVLPVLLGCSHVETPHSSRTNDASLDSLVIGNVTLKLGMSKDLVIPELQSKYDVQEFLGSWLIYEPKKDPRLGQARIGGIDFGEDGRLEEAWAWRTSSVGNVTIGDIGSSLFDLASQNVAHGKTACTLSVLFQPSPAVYMKDTYITCGHKQIQISWTDLTSKGKKQLPSLPDNRDSSGTEVLERLVKDPSSPAELQRMSSEYERLYSLTERLDKKK